MQYFDEELFKFLKQLKQNNKKEWFLKNKDRYEAKVKEPMLRFITDLRPKLHGINPKLKVVAKSNGGSMFRIYRDVRFSSDKSPYKTNAAAHFPYTGARSDVHTPGFYLQLGPGECFGGGGIWRPEAKELRMIRNRILDEPEAWKKVKSCKLEIEGDKLKRPPRGYNPEHPFIEDLKLKDFIFSVSFTEKQVCGRNFLDQYVSACQKMNPLMKFLIETIGYQWS